MHTHLEVAALVFVEEAESPCFHQLTNYFQGRLVVPLVHLPYDIYKQIDRNIVVDFEPLRTPKTLLLSCIHTSFAHTRHKLFE